MAVRQRLYLDNSAMNRPFDDQSQPRIAAETQGLISILEMIHAGRVGLITSTVVAFENDRNPFAPRKRWVEQLCELAEVQQQTTEDVYNRALELEAAGLKALDALHLAAAEAAGATHFVSCDDRLLKRYTGRLVATNPTDFVALAHRAGGQP